jgi:hypothetical protein
MKYDWHIKNIGLYEAEIQNDDKITLHISGDQEISHHCNMRTVYVLT